MTIVQTSFKTLINQNWTNLGAIQPLKLVQQTLLKALPQVGRDSITLLSILSFPLINLIPNTSLSKIVYGTYTLTERFCLKFFFQERVFKPLLSNLPGATKHYLNFKITRLVLANFIVASLSLSKWTVFGLANKVISKYILQDHVLKMTARIFPRKIQSFFSYSITRFLVANIVISMLFS